MGPGCACSHAAGPCGASVTRRSRPSARTHRWELGGREGRGCAPHLASSWPRGRSQDPGAGLETRGGGGAGSMSSYQQPVVIDNGSGVIKAGLAGSREPQLMYPNIIGRVKGQSWAQGLQELCVGDQAQNQRSSLFIRYRLSPGRQDPGEGGGGAQMRCSEGERKGEGARRAAARRPHWKCMGHSPPRIRSI